MSYTYLFNPRAAEEYENAFERYQQRSEVAADNLVIEVEETIRAVCQDPYRYRKTIKVYMKRH